MNCGDPLPGPLFPLLARPKTQHYDVGLLRCGVPAWWRLLQSQTCRSRAQWDWLRGQL